MTDNFPLAVITDLAKQRIEIDLLTRGSRNNPLETEFITKVNELKKVVPGKIRPRIEDLIEDEVQRQFRQNFFTRLNPVL
jgi:hypothetical protein